MKHILTVWAASRKWWGSPIESVGPDAKLNDLCRIFVGGDRSQAVMAQVVGFRDKHLLLTPFDSVDGIGIGAVVENTKAPLSIPVGDELLGHTLDGIGRPTDAEDLYLPQHYPVDATPPEPMNREIISQVLPLGVKAVDGLITVGKGQRIGIFARIRCWKIYPDGYVCTKHQGRYQCDRPDRRAWP